MSPQSFVYFIRAASGAGPIKIGSSSLPHKRLTTLDAASPYKLEIALKIPGDMRLEWRIHGHFAADHLQREWFKDTPRLNEFMWRLAEGAEVNALLGANSPVRRVTPAGRFPAATRECMSYRLRLNHAIRSVETRSRYYTVPQDVDAILRRWLGHKPFVADKRSPTADEIARIEAVIADPKKHALAGSRFRSWQALDDN